MTDLRNKILKVIEGAVNAPSGDNSQPWKFNLKGNKLTVFLVEGIDNTLYNFKEFGSFLAHGALIENISVLSSVHGLGAKIDMRFDPKTNGTATINFETETVSNSNQLASVVPARHTNRKPFRTEPLGELVKKELLGSSKFYENIDLAIIEDLATNKSLIQALSLNDELIFSNQYIHDTLFETISWTDEEDEKKVRGLFVKTMELNPDQVSAFKKMGNWTLMRNLKLLGIPKLIAYSNQKLYQASSAICLVSIPSSSAEDFLRGGRVLERVWLTATKLGLQVQPVSGIPYLALRIKSGDTSHLESDEIARILEADKKIRNVFGIGEKVIALIFRIGRGNPATARSKKLPPEVKES